MKLEQLQEAKYEEVKKEAKLHPALRTPHAAKLLERLKEEMEDMYEYGLEGMGPDWGGGGEFANFVLYEDHNHLGVSEALQELFSLVDEEDPNWDEWQDTIVDIVWDIAITLE